jgi:tetratricopeptide (TPR) repeat protein
MTTAPESRSPARRRRPLRLVLLAGAALSAAALVVGLRARYLRRPEGPIPPDIVYEGNEPALMDAVRRARDQVLKEPRSAKAWAQLGNVFLANELEVEGAACFAEAERLDSSNPRWPYHQGGVLINQGRRNEAVAFLRRAADLTGGRGEANAVLRLVLGETLLTLGGLDEAEALFRAVLGLQKDDPRANFDMGLLCVARKAWPAARDYLLRCLPSPQTRRKACLELSVVLQRLNEPVEADTYRRQAARLPADSTWVDPYVSEYLGSAVKKRARFRKAEQLEAAGRLAEAASEWASLALEFPDDDVALVSLGKVAGRMGKLTEAEHVLRQARQLAAEKMLPSYYLALVLYMQAEQHLQRGRDRAWAEARLREAVDLTRQALAIKPDYGVAHMTLGLSLKHLGQPTEAVAELRQAVRCNPEHAELHFRLGEALAEGGGNPAEARASLEQALEIAGPEVFWRRAAQGLLERLGNKPEARPGGK